MSKWTSLRNSVTGTVSSVLDPLGVFTGNNVISSLIPGLDLSSFNLTHPFSSSDSIGFWGLLSPFVGAILPDPLSAALLLLITNNDRSKSGFSSPGLNSQPTQNLFFTSLTPYLNEIYVGKQAFNLGGFTTLPSVVKFFKTHPNSSHFDFCSPIANSTLRLVFDDIEFRDNAGFINVGICYVGPATSCCPDTDPKDVLCVSLNYNTVDLNMTYPVPCHGQVYVGDEHSGLSTGGRCEYNDLCDVEKELLKRYSSSYIPEFNALETQSDLMKNRVLDLVYKNDGITWVRQQNMLDSVYHHCGVGNASHSIFWGGIHDSITDFEFSYNHSYAADMSASSYVPAISAWMCENRNIKTSKETNFSLLGDTADNSGTGPKAISIAANGYNTAALKSDGTVAAWGRNVASSCIPPVLHGGSGNINWNTWYGSEGLGGIAVHGWQGGSIDLGDVTQNEAYQLCLKNQTAGQTVVPTNLLGVIAITVGYDHMVALKSDGTLVAWGSNTQGQTSIPAGLTDVIAIAAGDAHTLALKSNGTIVAWGRNIEGQTTVPSTLTDVIAIAAGHAHSIALKSNGTVVAWGWDMYGQTDIPVGLTDVTAIAAGNAHTLALKGDGTVVAWGLNNSGQCTVPGDLTGVTAIAGGLSHTLALKSDGTIVAWGDNTYGQISTPSTLTNAIAIAAGDYHTVAIRNDKAIISWGYNNEGQINTPTNLTWPIGTVELSYNDIFTNKSIYSSPYWKTLSSSLLFDNPKLIDVTSLIPPKSNNFLKYARDPDFPEIRLLKLYSADGSESISFNGVTTFSNLVFDLDAQSLVISGAISGSGDLNILTGGSGSIVSSNCVHAPQPTGYGISRLLKSLSDNIAYQTCLQNNYQSSTGDYLGKSQTNDLAFDVLAETISGNNIITGRMYIKEVYMDINGAGYLYPSDINPAIPKTNENKFLQISKLELNESGGTLWYNVNYVFNYTTLTGGTSAYALVADGTMTFDSLDDVWLQCIDNKIPIKTNCYTNVLTNMGITSARRSSGTGVALQTNGYILFDIVDADGVMIGTTNTDSTWTTSLEDCGDTITSFLDISAQVGQKVKPRWGTALWCLAFDSGSANFNFAFDYDYAIETADENNGLIHYETATVNLSADSIAAVLNNRVLLRGHSIDQDQHYDTINNAVVAGLFSITGASYTHSNIMSCTPLTTLTTDTSCYRGTAEQICQDHLSGTLTFACSSCAYTLDISSQMYFYDKVTLVEKDNTYKTVNYNILSPCSLMISGSHVTIPTGPFTINQYSIGSINPHSCVDGSLYEMLTASISGFLICGSNYYYSNTYIVPVSAVFSSLSNDNITGTIYCNIKSPEKWKISSVQFYPGSGVCSETNSFTINPAYISGVPKTVAEAGVNGAVTYTGGSCCSGDANFPIPSLDMPWRGFVYNNTEITENADYEVVAAVTYDVSATWCSDMIGSLIITMSAAQETTFEVYCKECVIGNLAVNLVGCEIVKSPPISAQNLIFSSTIPTSGYTYSEWATSIIQEFRDDKRYNISDNWIISNAYDINTKNTGRLYKNSLWKRYMDGVGLGGDTPDYDSIINSGTFNENPIEEWTCIGTWNVGQMAFGDPDRAVIAGGHKVNRAAGELGIGLGIHAPLSTKRTFMWDYTNVPEEDSYLRNYMGRRFNASYTSLISSSTFPISSCENTSDLNCVIFDAESEMIVERSGSIYFDGNQDSQTIKFTEAFPDSVGTTYSISLTLSDNVRAWWSNKSSTGFDVSTEIKGWKGHVDYTASAIVKVTEEDISKLGPQDGYTFDEIP